MFMVGVRWSCTFRGLCFVDAPKFCRPFKFYLSQESPHKQCTKERHNSTNTILNTYRKHQCFNIIRRLLAFNGAPKFQSLLWHMNPTPRTKKVLDLPNAASEKVRKTRNSHVRTFLGGINVSRWYKLKVIKFYNTSTLWRGERSTKTLPRIRTNVIEKYWAWPT